jgi:hypothetical protein
MTMNLVKTYNIANDVAGELIIDGAIVAYSFKAGTVTAETPQDEAILEHLASIGLATLAVPAQPSEPTTSKKAAAKPASEPTDKE